jgi:hypothetical protein
MKKAALAFFIYLYCNVRSRRFVFSLLSALLKRRTACGAIATEDALLM